MSSESLLEGVSPSPVLGSVLVAGGPRGATGGQGRAFRLRFPRDTEPGRSYLSPHRPKQLPCPVMGKWYSSHEQRELAALKIDGDQSHVLNRRVEPEVLASHDYGWWLSPGRRPAPPLPARYNWPKALKQAHIHSILQGLSS